MKIFTFLLTIILTLSISVFAQVNQTNAAKATYTKEIITVDGLLNESSWKTADAIMDFTQRELNEGEKSTEKTEVRLLYDDGNIYVGVWCYDSNPNEIIASGLERDFDYELDDNFEIILDTYLDKRNGYLFITNPNAARFDALVTDEGNGINTNWNGIWDVRTAITSEGWFAEIIIPFTTLKFYDKDSQMWGVNFERNIRRKREQVLWKAWLRNYELEKLSQAGELHGIENIKNKTLIELKPFAIGGIQKGYEPYDFENTTTTKIGLDAKYSLTSSLTLDATINTDFAQVEADQEIINLTRFPLFFPEKREFFLEGADIFITQFGGMIYPFYSRRIGLNSARQLIPIYGGLRLVGTVNQSNLGFLTMQTAEKYGEPTMNYTVARLKQNVLESSYIGFLTTNKQSSYSYNRFLGMDGLWTNSNVFGNNTLVIGGAFGAVFSPSIKSGNLAYRFYIDYPNDLIDYFIGITAAQKNFIPEMGFVARNDFNKFSSALRIQPRPEIPFIQYLQFKPFELDYYYDREGVLQSLYYEGRPLGFSTESGEFFEFNIQRTADRLNEDFDIFDGIIIPSGLYWWTNYEIQFETNSSRPFSGALFYRWGDFYNGKRDVMSLELVGKINKHLQIAADYTRNYITLPDGNFTTHEIASRINYNFSTMLSTSIFVQWNNEVNEINFNFRLHWIPSLGSEVYLVYNELLDSKKRSLKPEVMVIQLKGVYYLPLKI
ncbi:MAG: carbohydrate binding family 9 domain-containing protein [Ignavibacteriales bacterium]|nr:carbohydrate binding family 9 domain-containing protein [Ignavibacteriales bacterium]